MCCMVCNCPWGISPTCSRGHQETADHRVATALAEPGQARWPWHGALREKDGQDQAGTCVCVLSGGVGLIMG